MRWALGYPLDKAGITKEFFDLRVYVRRRREV